jgi:hypothetical protein
MDYSKKQSQLDIKKWVDSETKGCDTCGSYNYCSNCNKTEAYPCAVAYEKYSAISKMTKTTSTTKKCATKKTTKSTTTAKKSSTATKRTTKSTVTA